MGLICWVGLPIGLEHRCYHDLHIWVVTVADSRSQELDSRRKMNLCLMIRHCQQTQFILMMNSMLKDKDITLSLVNELIKLNGSNDLLYLAELGK